jgi:hypothetical protein
MGLNASIHDAAAISASIGSRRVAVQQVVRGKALTLPSMLVNAHRSVESLLDRLGNFEAVAMRYLRMGRDCIQGNASTIASGEQCRAPLTSSIANSKQSTSRQPT